MANKPTGSPLDDRLGGKLVKALRIGLAHRELTDTSLYDWAGDARPEVVAQLTEERLKQIKGFGPMSLADVKQYLASHGLALRTNQQSGAAAPTTMGEGPLHEGNQ